MNKHKPNRFAGLDLLDSRSKAELHNEQRIDIELACRASMLAFKSGHANQSHWNTLAYCLNVAMCLTELDVMKHGLSAIEGGQDALEIVRNIGNLKLGSHAFAISCAVNILKKQLCLATNQQVKAAIAEVLKRNEQSRLENKRR